MISSTTIFMNLWKLDTREYQRLYFHFLGIILLKQIRIPVFPLYDLLYDTVFYVNTQSLQVLIKDFLFLIKSESFC